MNCRDSSYGGSPPALPHPRPNPATQQTQPGGNPLRVLPAVRQQRPKLNLPFCLHNKNNRTPHEKRQCSAHKRPTSAAIASPQPQQTSPQTVQVSRKSDQNWQNTSLPTNPFLQNHLARMYTMVQNTKMYPKIKS